MGAGGLAEGAHGISPSRRSLRAGLGPGGEWGSAAVQGPARPEPQGSGRGPTGRSGTSPRCRRGLGRRRGRRPAALLGGRAQRRQRRGAAERRVAGQDRRNGGRSGCGGAAARVGRLGDGEQGAERHRRRNREESYSPRTTHSGGHRSGLRLPGMHRSLARSTSTASDTPATCTSRSGRGSSRGSRPSCPPAAAAVRALNPDCPTL